MRFSELEKGLIVTILNTVYKNIKNSENPNMFTTDENLIMSFDKSSFHDLEKIIKKAQKEYEL